MQDNKTLIRLFDADDYIGVELSLEGADYGTIIKLIGNIEIVKNYLVSNMEMGKNGLSI